MVVVCNPGGPDVPAGEAVTACLLVWSEDRAVGAWWVGRLSRQVPAGAGRRGICSQWGVKEGLHRE